MADNNNNQDAPATQGSDTKALTPLQQTAGLVAKYAGKLINDERAQQFYARVLLLARQEPKIAMCTQDSLLAAMMACVHLDLMPNTPEQLAFIIPYKNKKLNIMQAQFQLGYKGMIQLAYKSAGIASINAELVFPQDKFEVDYGMRTINHKPDLTIDRTDYSKAVACYAVALPANGSTPIFDVMSRSEIDKVRKVVKAESNDAPWATWEEAMVKKTVVKRLTKMLPQSSKDNRLQFAAAFDSWAEVGKLSVNAQGEVVENEPAAPAVDAAKIAADVAAAKAAVHTTETTEGDDPHKDDPRDNPPAGKNTSRENEPAEGEVVEPEQPKPLTEKQRKDTLASLDKLGLNAYGRTAFLREATKKITDKHLTDDDYRELAALIAYAQQGDFNIPETWQKKTPAKGNAK